MSEAAVATAAVAAGAGRGVELCGIRKSFGALVANDDVDLQLRWGEVHALLGENGAGKTTLMNILAGLVRRDAGDVLVDGEPVRIRTPKDAARAGIGMVHQHFRLIERLTVAENIHIGWRDTPALARTRSLVRRAEALAAELGMDVDCSAHVWQLSIGEQQRVAILRTLVRGARVLVLDEPTAVLTPQEAEDLFRVMRAMAAQGKTVVFISHKLEEVLGVTDRVTVLRGGRRVDTVETAHCDAQRLARMMVGRDIRPAARTPRRGERGAAVVAAEGVRALDDRGVEALRGIDLELRAGEILGVAGVAGNGQRELAEVLTGLRRASAGRVVVTGRDLTRAGAAAFIRAGVAHIPEDRQRTGLVPSEPIWRNAILKTYRRQPIAGRLFLRPARAREFATGLRERAQIAARSVDVPIGQLSGGNAQRLLTYREIAAASVALVAAHPTRGIDVGATEQVRQALIDARDAGTAVLLISEDLEELLRVSDRLVVLYEGRVVGEFPADEADLQVVGLLMGGSAVAAEEAVPAQRAAAAHVEGSDGA